MSVIDALNRLAKWRTLLAGWQLGTRPDTDPECQAVRDHRELTLMMRVELSAMAALLIEKKVFTQAEWENQLVTECKFMHGMLEQKFPGARATDAGVVIDIQKADWIRKWKP